MSVRPNDPYSLTDEELIDEIKALNASGRSVKAIVDRLEIKYGEQRTSRYDLVSAIVYLIGEDGPIRKNGE